MTVIAWIQSNNDSELTVTDAGFFATAEGRVTFLDPLAFYESPSWIDVPDSGGRVIVFFDPKVDRNSKLALVFGDGEVAGGNSVAMFMVDAGMASVFTPTTHAAQFAFAKSLGHGNLYDDYFEKFDDPSGGERKIASLPDGTPVPYVHSGWGDGVYSVFTLTDTNGYVLAVYTDFIGRNAGGDWLVPPGLALEELD